MQLLYHHRQKLCSAGLVEYRVTKLEKYTNTTSWIHLLVITTGRIIHYSPF